MVATGKSGPGMGPRVVSVRVMSLIFKKAAVELSHIGTHS
jgi:hypothetical protein